MNKRTRSSEYIDHSQGSCFHLDPRAVDKHDRRNDLRVLGVSALVTFATGAFVAGALVFSRGNDAPPIKEYPDQSDIVSCDNSSLGDVAQNLGDYTMCQVIGPDGETDRVMVQADEAQRFNEFQQAGEVARLAPEE